VPGSPYEAPARHRLVDGASVHLPIVQANRYVHTGSQVKNVGDQPVKVRLTLRNAAPATQPAPSTPAPTSETSTSVPRPAATSNYRSIPRLELDLVRDCSGEPRFTGSASLDVVPTPDTGQGPITAILTSSPP